MIGSLVRALGFCATVLVAVLIAAAPVQADDCQCTHQGKPVKCPADLSPGSKSVEFVKGGTLWAPPNGPNVFVPMTTFATCPGPTATKPAPPGASATTPPPPDPRSTQTSVSPPQPPALKQPSETRPPGGQPIQGSTPKTVPPGDLARAQQEHARALIEEGPPQPGSIAPSVPGQSTETETDEAISRLGRLIQQQPSTAREKPPETPVSSARGNQPLPASSQPPRTPAAAVPAETSGDPSAPEEGPGDEDLNRQDTLIGENVGETPPAADIPKDELAELEIKKEQAAAMDPVEIGRSVIKYTITVTNNGPAAAKNVEVVDYMMKGSQPAPLLDAEGVKVAKDATSDNAQGSTRIAKDDKGNFVSGDFKLPLLAKGATWTITYQVEPTAPGTLVNGAAFRGDNLKRGWRKEFTLWTVKHGIAQDDWAQWHFFRGKGFFEWAVDAAFTEVGVITPSK